MSTTTLTSAPTTTDETSFPSTVDPSASASTASGATDLLPETPWPETDTSGFVDWGSQESSGAATTESSQDAAAVASSQEGLWVESDPPATLAPETEAPTPEPTAEASTKSSSGGGSATISVVLALVALAAVLGFVFFMRRRRRRNNVILGKHTFQGNRRHNQRNSLGTPTESIELPPPSSPGKSFENQRASVFSNVRYGGESIFNTTAAISPKSQRGAAAVAAGGAAGRGGPAAYNAPPSMTYRLLDPSPGTTPSAVNLSTAQTPQRMQQPLRPQAQAPAYQPQYNQRLPRPAGTTTTTAVAAPVGRPIQSGWVDDDDRLSTASSVYAKVPNADGPRDTNQSMASTVHGLHDSLCDDLFKYGDGLGRERTQSRGDQHKPQYVTSQQYAQQPLPPRAPMPSQAEGVEPAQPEPLPVTRTKKTLSITEMRAAATQSAAAPPVPARRAPPPPPPPAAPASSHDEELAPFDPALLTSVLVYKQRASEDDEPCVALPSPRIFSKQFTQDQIQRLSDVSSVSSDNSTLRAGSLIEAQVVETKTLGGHSREIQI